MQKSLFREEVLEKLVSPDELGRCTRRRASQEEFAHGCLGIVVGSRSRSEQVGVAPAQCAGREPIAVATRYIVWYSTPTFLSVVA